MRKWLIYIIGIFCTILIVTLGIAPNLVTGYLNNNSRDLSGRAFVIGDIDVNYFTGNICIEDFYMLEQNEIDTFISFGELRMNISLLRSIFGSPTLESLDLYSPVGVVIQDSVGFNFDDLIEFHTSGDTSEDPSEDEELYYLIENINVHKGELTYTLTDINSTIGFQNIEIECPKVSSDNPEIQATTTVEFLHGGRASAQGMVNIRSYEYMVRSNVDSLHLSFMEPALIEYMNISRLSGYASSSMEMTGNYENTDIINASGQIQVNSFELRGPDSTEVVYFNSFELKMDTIELENAHFDIEYIKLDSVFTLFELYENDNNFERLLGTTTTNINDSVSTTTSDGSTDPDPESDEEESLYLTIANSINSYFQEYSIAQYNIDELEVTRSAVIFRDFTLDDEFEYRITAMNASGEGLNSKKEKVRLEAECILNESGIFEGECELDPLNFLNLEMHYTISDFKIYDFSSHSRHYVSYPIMDGRMVYKCDLVIQDGILENYNYIQINDFDFGDKDKKDPIYKLPVKMAVGLLKDREGVINLEVPVTGDLNDPKFHIWKTIMGILKNLIVKAAAAPYELVAGMFEDDADAAENIYLIPGSGDLKEGYQRSAKGIFVMAREKPDINFEFVLMTDSILDMQAIAVKIMKEKYHNTSLSDTGHSEIRQPLNEYPPEFTSYLDSLAGEEGAGMTIEEKCLLLADHQALSEKYHQMNIKRKLSLEKGLSDQLVPESRYHIRPATKQEIAGQKSLPKYHIHFTHGDNQTTSNLPMPPQ